MFFETDGSFPASTRKSDQLSAQVSFNIWLISFDQFTTSSKLVFLQLGFSRIYNCFTVAALITKHLGYRKE